MSPTLRRVVMLAVMLFLSSCMCSQEPDSPLEYQVVRGDTLYRIAKAHKVTVKELKEWNGLSSDLLKVGDVLVIHSTSPKVEASKPVRARRKRNAPSTTNGADFVLSMPTAKTCLRGPQMDALDTEEGFISSAGLTMDQLRTSMKSFLHHTLRCIPEGTQPEGVVYTEIKVACTGQVDQVVILDTDTMPDDLVECVQKTLKYTPFPAHDMPDGFVFEYPVRFSF